MIAMSPLDVEEKNNKLTKRREEDQKECLAIIPIRPECVGEGGESEQCHVPQLHSSTEAMRAAVFSDRGLIVYLNGAGWLGEMSVSSGKRNQPATGRV